MVGVLDRDLVELGELDSGALALAQPEELADPE